MVRKKLVLNACGVKSLGGVKLFVEAFELLVESDNEIIVLYSENEFFTLFKTVFAAKLVVPALTPAVL